MIEALCTLCRVGIVIVLISGPAAGEQLPLAQAPGWLAFGFGHTPPTEEAPGFLRVLRIIPDGPAQQAGLQVGDRVTHLDGKALSFTSQVALLDVFRAIRADQKVLLTIQRGAQHLQLTLRAIPMPPELEAAWEENYKAAKRHDQEQEGPRAASPLKQERVAPP